MYSFTGTNDGANPNGLVQGSDGYLYGTTYYGGTNNWGTVFTIITNGVLTSLYSFTSGYNGAVPFGLVQGSDGNFYGTTYYGGTSPGNSGYGTVFKINTNGGLTSLHSFTGGNDGAYPGDMAQGTDGNFYGTTYYGGTSPGTNGYGTVFKISTGGALTTLYSFTGGNDGAYHFAVVQGSDGYFYGTTDYGGKHTNGTLFKISTDGSLTNLYSFGTVQGTNGIPLDGSYANTMVQGSDGYFYGTTEYGGMNGGYGTVFKISTNGAFTSLYSFTGTNDGANPFAALVLGRDGSFYGTTFYGGAGGAGTVFRLTIVPEPQVTITPSGANVILTWPTNFTDFTLQSTTNLGSSAIWTTNLPAPVVVNGQNVVTNPITGNKQFFRLSQ